MVLDETRHYIHKAQAFLAKTEGEPGDFVETALRDWQKAQSLTEPHTFVMQIGRSHGSALWAVLAIELTSASKAFQASRPTIQCTIPLHEGTKPYADHEKGIPWMARANRKALLDLETDASPARVDAVKAYGAMSLMHNATYGPFHASTSGGGYGDFSLHISEAQWTVFPDSFTIAFAQTRGRNELSVARTNLFVASALYGSITLEETFSFSFMPADRDLLVREAAPISAS